MIKAVTVTNYIGESKRFVLPQPELSGFALFRMEGIGPPKATINTTESVTLDGSSFNSSRAQQRNIVLSLMFLPTPLIEDARHETYKYFPIKQRVTLLIETDRRTVETYGYVESNEVDIFSSVETTQISIICPDPYFYSEGYSSTIFYGIEPAFEFIFSNESLMEPLIEFGYIRNMTEQTVWYEGDAETGVTITIHVVGEVHNITIYNVQTREKMRIDTNKLEALTGRGLSSGDEVIINTVRGEKSVKLLREGLYSNILNCLDKGSDWFTLHKGDNVFTYVADSGAENLQFKIENRTVYEGV